MVIYTLLLLAILTFQSPLQYSVWKVVFSYQWMRFASFFFLLSMFAHAWIGMHDILVDYVHSIGIRLGLQAAVIFALLVYTAWSIQILWGA